MVLSTLPLLMEVMSWPAKTILESKDLVNVCKDLLNVWNDLVNECSDLVIECSYLVNEWNDLVNKCSYLVIECNVLLNVWGGGSKICTSIRTHVQNSWMWQRSRKRVCRCSRSWTISSQCIHVLGVMPVLVFMNNIDIVLDPDLRRFALWGPYKFGSKC